MDHPEHPRNTREFMALWNAATEEHLVHKVSDALVRLAPGGLTAQQAAALAPLLVRAFHVAAAPAGGAHVAAQFLAELDPDTAGGT